MYCERLARFFHFVVQFPFLPWLPLHSLQDLLLSFLSISQPQSVMMEKPEHQLYLTVWLSSKDLLSGPIANQMIQLLLRSWEVKWQCHMVFRSQHNPDKIPTSQLFSLLVRGLLERPYFGQPHSVPLLLTAMPLPFIPMPWITKGICGFCQTSLVV